MMDNDEAVTNVLAMQEAATKQWIERVWAIFYNLRQTASRLDYDDLSDDALFGAAVEIMRSERSGR